jgi:uncharacterized protein (DUF736 family)
MIIGQFKKNDADGSFAGDIVSYALRVAGVTIRPVEKKGEGPDFIVDGTNDEGEAFELGAGWMETSTNGKPYIAVRMDAPTLAEPIQCALTRQPDSGYTLVWSRRKKPKQNEEAATF